MTAVYLFRTGDIEFIRTKTSYLIAISNEELISSYKREAKMGIVGVRAQMLHIIALHQVFLKRFKKSPIKIEENTFISLTGEIIYNKAEETFVNAVK